MSMMSTPPPTKKATTIASPSANTQPCLKRHDASIQKKWRTLFLFIAIAIVGNLHILLRCVNPSLDYAGGTIISDSPAEIISSSLASSTGRGNNGKGSLPTVACFFMVDQKSVEKAMAVRYSNWGKRCTNFVIISNGSNKEEHIDDNTILVDIHYVMQLEFKARNITAITNRTRYINFPSPENETKQYLTLKSFYSWMYMTRKFGTTSIDYIMKVDPDTYMLMDNYLNYLNEYYNPNHQVYVGRVFKTNGNHRDAFVTGLSATLSHTTAKLLLDKSAIQKHEDRPYNECSAETFLHGGEADDHALSVCLSSMGIYPAYTRDDMGRERFLHFNPSEHVFDARNEPGWYKMFSFTPHLPRSGCCS